MEIDRRHILLGAGAALTLAACKKEGAGNESAPDSSNDRSGEKVAKAAAFLEKWNFGDDPWDSFERQVSDETPLPTASFAAGEITVLHLEIAENPLELKAWRCHFDTADGATDNLTKSHERVAQVIEYFNALGAAPSPAPSPSPSPSPSPTPTPTKPAFVDKATIKSGLKGFGFLRANHFVIYVKNPGIAYSEFPIWFGEKLIEPVGADYRASPNRSFFNAQTKTITVKGVPYEVIYVQNYFYTATETVTDTRPTNRKAITNEKIKYSLNINARINAKDVVLPLVIDPDTGNMGGGTEGDI